MFIWYENIEGIFHFRIAGVLIRNRAVLVQSGIDDDAFALPGGHVEMFERSEDTLIREFKEEMNADIKVNRLLWIQEHMSEWGNRKHHSLCFYYLIDLEKDTKIPLKGTFYSEKNNDSEIEFSWVGIDELKERKFFPIFMKDKLNSLPSTPERFVEQEIR